MTGFVIGFITGTSVTILAFALGAAASGADHNEGRR